MPSKSRTDEAYDYLSNRYNPGKANLSISDLLEQFYTEFNLNPDKQWMTPGWLNYIVQQGATGTTHSDKDYDFWIRDLAGLLGPVQQTAEATWLAAAYNPAVKDWLVDLNGHGHHMRLGSSGVAAILDKALVLPGNVNSYTSTPDDNSLDIVGDIDLIAKVALDDWTPTAFCGVISKWDQAAFTGYELAIDATGQLRLTWASGGVNNGFASTVAAVVPDGGIKWIRTTLDVNNGAANFDLKFYTSDDGIVWTQLGATINGGGVTAIAADAGVLELGRRRHGGLNPVAGKIYRAIIKNGIDGATVFDADFSKQPDGIPWFTESTGKRVTVNPGRSAVCSGALYLPGIAGQYAESPDNNILDITTELDISVRVLPDTWTAQSFGFIEKYVTSSGNQRSWILGTDDLAANGKLKLYISGNGVETPSALSSVAVPFVVGTAGWIRATWRASDGRVQFFTAADSGSVPSAWTQLGTNQVLNPLGGAAFNSTAPIRLGTHNEGTSSVRGGKWFRAIVKSAIDGPIVFDVDFTTWKTGDGMGGYPKLESTGKPVRILSNTTGDDTNDPKWLKYSATAGLPESKGMYLPGVGGNYASVPDAANLRFVASADIQCEVSLDDWTPGPTCRLISKTGGGAGYTFDVNTNGTLSFTKSGVAAYTSTSPIAAIDGQRLWVRVTDSSIELRFYTSTDGITWIQLGNPVGCLPTITDNNNFRIGADFSGNTNLIGRVFKVRASDTINGALVLDIDFSKATEPYATFNADTGQVVTLNRSASGRKLAIVDRPMFLFGTDDYMECADHDKLDFALADSFSVAKANRFYGNNIASYWQLFGKGDLGGVGPAWGFIKNSGDNRIYYQLKHPGITVDTLASATSYTPGLAAVSTGVRNVSADNIQSFHDSAGSSVVTDITTATLAGTNPVRIGQSSAGSLVADMEFIGAAVWRKSLTPTEVISLDSEFKTNA